MKAVMSFWTKPVSAQLGRAQLSRRDAMMWALSSGLLKRHVARTQLVTDSAGARFLIDELALPFDEVSLALDPLAEADPAFWALGKLHAYSLQNEPWVHVDHDVFLLQPLPPALLARPVFAQCAETFELVHSRNTPYSRNAEVFAALPDLPPYFRRLASRRVQSAANTGILGGNALEFLREYAETALAILRSGHNGEGIARLQNLNAWTGGWALIFALEQWSLWALSVERGIGIAYRFPDTWYFPKTVEAAKRHGYLHLLGAMKEQPHWIAWVEEQVREQFPGTYERVLRREAALSASPPSRTWSPVPAAPTAPGETGSEAHDDNFHYICTRENTWKRHSLNKWETANL